MAKNKITKRVKVVEHNFSRLDIIRAMWYPIIISIIAFSALSFTTIGFYNSYIINDKLLGLTSKNIILILFLLLLIYLWIFYSFNFFKLAFDILKADIYLYDVPVKGHFVYTIKGAERTSWWNLVYTKKY